MAAQEQIAVNVVDFAKARLPELEALDEELDKNQRDAPRHLRRRARSHTAPFLAKKNPNNPNPTRRARRKPSELLKAHNPHAADVELRFLETHVWHAKRFAMVDDGGWRRPDYRRDRGLKAALRSLRTAALVFDATAQRTVEAERAAMAAAQQEVAALREEVAAITIHAPAVSYTHLTLPTILLV